MSLVKNYLESINPSLFDECVSIDERQRFVEGGRRGIFFLDPWHNYLNMARPFVSLSNMSRPPDIPEFYRRSLRRARSSNHPSHPFLGPVKRRQEKREREKTKREKERERGDKGLTYRSVTRYPTRFLPFFSPLFPSLPFCSL